MHFRLMQIITSRSMLSLPVKFRCNVMIYEEVVLRFNNTRSTLIFKQKFGSICGFWIYGWLKIYHQAIITFYFLLSLSNKSIYFIVQPHTRWIHSERHWMNFGNKNTHGPHYWMTHNKFRLSSKLSGKFITFWPVAPLITFCVCELSPST